jgi:hypothetical protein
VPDDPREDLERLLETLRERVDARRVGGVYPPGLEEDLDRHFRMLAGERPASPSFTMDELEEALRDLQHFAYGREHISLDSNLPGGRALHRAVGKTVARQIQGVLDQAQDQSRRVAHTITLLTEVTNTLADAFDRRVLQQIDDLQVRLTEQQRALHAAIARVEDAVARVPGTGVDAWYTEDAFTGAFRGSSADIRERYRDLASLFVGCAPVADLGFGRGEFLELLRDLNVDASGVEVDDALVSDARSRGLQVAQSGAVEYLESVPDGSLGGIVMIQVIEHLTPQHVVDVVKVAADKLRAGGRAVVETVNPTSLYTYAHAFWVDPTHTRPVHPNFLRFLFEEAGFARVERVDRSPVDANESLEMLPGDDELTKRLNANFDRLNALLFGPQDYAIVATR